MAITKEGPALKDRYLMFAKRFKVHCALCCMCVRIHDRWAGTPYVLVHLRVEFKTFLKNVHSAAIDTLNPLAALSFVQ